MADTDIPDTARKIDARDKNVPWYSNNLSAKLSDSALELLLGYSKYRDREEVEKQVLKIRDEAWQVWPYVCIGEFYFVVLVLSRLPFYPTILERLKTGNEQFLDLGCCLGQDIRKLVADGAPSEYLYGSDIKPEFFDLGYKLFCDKETLKSTFIAADIFDTSSNLKSLDDKIDIVYIGAFLHLFNYEEQATVCKRLVTLLRAKPGSVIVGSQVGHLKPGERVHEANKSQKMWSHNAKSFSEMWDEVGLATNSKWRVEAVEGSIPMNLNNDRGRWHDPDVIRLIFTVFRE